MGTCDLDKEAFSHRILWGGGAAEINGKEVLERSLKPMFLL